MRNRTEHDCPKVTQGTHVPVFNSNTPCAVCHSDAVLRFSEWLPYLSELKAWVDDGSEYSLECSEMLYEHFMSDLDYGTLTGDTGTIDEWLCDRVEYVKDLVDTIEFYHPQEAA